MMAGGTLHKKRQGGYQKKNLDEMEPSKLINNRFPLTDRTPYTVLEASA